MHKQINNIKRKHETTDFNNKLSGYYQGGYTGSASSSPTVIKDSIPEDLYERFIDAVEEFADKADKPFKGYVTYKGDDGIEAAEVLDEKMRKNISR